MDLFGEGIAWLADTGNWTDPRNGILLRLWEHVSLSASSLLVAGLIALPMGLWIGHTGRGATAVIAIANIGRAVPSVGWLGIVFPLTLALFGRGGLGFLPSLIALVALAIPPMVTNTYAGLREVDRDLVEAGRGMGMREMEILRHIEVPVALPVILAGIRVSAVQTVATATLASIVGGGTLGEFIVQGIFVRALDRVVGAAILVAALAILTELTFSFIQRRATSPGLSGRREWSPMDPGQVGRTTTD
ncbi:MAG: ABC transporter permease [Chloroflexi bacterium]|nr:ABC transporter permease [Chloroflexota bacterium]